MIVPRSRHRCPKPFPFQDTRYGGGRVCNPVTKGPGSGSGDYARCTVCGQVFLLPVREGPKEEKESKGDE